MKHIAVLASGGGSNLAALIAAQSKFSSYRVTLVLSNIPDARALELARLRGVEALCVPNRGLPRQTHEERLRTAIEGRGIDLLCLAGYLRILGSDFMRALTIPILNIHPSLLPAFPGMHAQKQALDAGVRWSGATVHFVDTGLDTGPILMQRPVRVEQDDTEESLSARILKAEHEIYPQAVNLVALGRYEVLGRRTRILSADYSDSLTGFASGN